MNHKTFLFLPALVFAVLFSMTSPAADKLVFACDFSNGFQPQTCVQPCEILSREALVVDAPGGKALRFGKKADGSLSRLVYRMRNMGTPGEGGEAQRPFPMRFGRLEFKFRPVDWKLGDPPFNMLLTMSGPLKTNLHITYTRPGSTGLASIQAAYGQNGNPQAGKGQRASLFPFTELNTNRDWHSVKFEWNPAMLKLTADGRETILSTRDLVPPGRDFYATQLMIGAETASVLRGLTDLTDLKIYSTFPEENKADNAPDRFPEVSILPMKKPVIDGVITPGEWSSASALSGFKSLPRGYYSPHQPKVRIGYDAENLYFSIISDGHNHPPRVKHTGRDANLWEDDGFEFHFDPTPETPDSFQWIVNHAGAVFDQHVQPGTGVDECRSWNCSGLKTAVGHVGKQWVLEAAIPFASLEAKAPRPGEKWLFNLCETLPGEGLYSLAGVLHSYGEHDKLGLLKFSEAAAPRIEIAGFGELFTGKADFRMGAGRVQNGKVEITAKRYDETARTEFPLFSESRPLNAEVRSVFSAGADKLGKNGVLYVNLFNGPDRIYAGRFSYEVSEEAEIEFLRRIVKDGKNFLKVQTAQAAASDARLSFDIQDKTGHTVLHRETPVAGMRQETLIPLSGLAEGDYTIGFRLLDAKGNPVKTAEARPFTVFGEKLPWEGCRLGMVDHVPNPWTPLKVTEGKNEITVQCWNRIYTFGGHSLFIEQIRSGSTDYLAEPVRLLLRAGNVKNVSGIEAKLVSSNDRAAVIAMTGNAVGWGRIKVTATVEYDGFIWYDLELMPDKPGKIDELAIDLNSPRDASSLLNSGYRTLVNTGYTPKHWTKKLNDMFGPFWIGNESGGISLGIESAEHWSNRDEGRQATVDRDNGNARVVIHPIDAGRNIKGRLEYGFYLHPTPVRPRPAVFHTMRAQDWFGHNREEYKGNPYPSNLSWWMGGFYYQGTPDWSTNRKQIEEQEKIRGIQYRPYYHYDNLTREKSRSGWYAAYSSIGRNSPATIWCGESWRSGTQDKLYGDTLYGYYDDMIEVCKTPDYCNYYLWQFDRTRKANPSVDGLYFDLMFWPACTRADHHHGYADANGVRHPTWTVREHRRWLERIYVYCHENGKQAPVLTHLSGSTSRVAGFSFVDYYVDGELWCDVLVKARSYKDMKLDQLRAEVLPSIYGPGLIWISQLHRLLPFVPATQRKNWRVEPWAERHMAGMLLLHEIIPDRTSQFDVAWKIWKALDRFGFAENDRMLPYWRHDMGIGGSADGERTAVTGYLKGKEKLLLVVFNNNDAEVPVRIVLDMEKLFGKTMNIAVRDLESQRDIYRGKPDFPIPVAKRDFLLLEVNPVR